MSIDNNYYAKSEAWFTIITMQGLCTVLLQANFLMTRCKKAMQRQNQSIVALLCTVTSNTIKVMQHNASP